MRLVLPLEECPPELTALVGGKAAGLSALLRHGMRVPPAFVVTADAYRRWVEETGLQREIERTLGAATALETRGEASVRIRTLLERADLSSGLEAEIGRAYEELSSEAGDPALAVAVRSSASDEDSADASFAGQQETFLWVRGGAAVKRSVVLCWASLFTLRAIAYRIRLGLPPAAVTMGVVVQKMVPAEVAGVMMTIDPVTGDRSAIGIEASFGLGFAVVGGELTPDRYVMDKVTLQLRSRAIATKPFGYGCDPERDGVRRFDVPEPLQRSSCLTAEEVIDLARAGKAVERLFGTPQDVEWAMATGLSGVR